MKAGGVKTDRCSCRNRHEYRFASTIFSRERGIFCCVLRNADNLSRDQYYSKDARENFTDRWEEPQRFVENTVVDNQPEGQG